MYRDYAVRTKYRFTRDEDFCLGCAITRCMQEGRSSDEDSEDEQEENGENTSAHEDDGVTY